jgi:SAM-dependent methyltransferase
MRVLELNCGTGEDALWLAQRGVHVLATDASEAMLAVARVKAEATPFAKRIAWQALDLAHPPAECEGGFDGALSNFGGLNCLADRRGVAEFLARAVRPGGRVVLVIMGPWCPWEVAWYATHFQFRTAARRRRRDGVDAEVHGARVRVWYPSRPGAPQFAPWFRAAGLYAIGALLPPPYLGGLVERYPGLFARLGSAEPARGGRVAVQRAQRSLFAGTGAPMRLAMRHLLQVRYRLFQTHRHNRRVMEDVAGRRLIVLPGVFNPKLFRTGEFLARVLTVEPLWPEMRVLDMGTGSGVGAVFAALAGAQVTAVDVNPAAVAARPTRA